MVSVAALSPERTYYCKTIRQVVTLGVGTLYTIILRIVSFTKLAWYILLHS